MGKMNKESRRQSVEKFNTGQANVLLISRAGGEGLDLVATNIVYILEPTWNDAAIQQIIGRAVRRNSHASLPPAERVVHVYSMMLLKPVESELVRRRTNPRWGALSNRLFTDDEVSDLKKISEDFDSDLNQLRKVTYEHEDKHKSVLDDEYLSIDLYLYKFIRKKQKKIDQSIEYLKTRSSQCHHLERIQQEMDRFVPPPPIIEEKEDMLSLDELKERIKNLMGQDTIIFEQSFDEKVPYDKSFPMITFKDVIEEVKKSGSSEFRNLEENKKLKYYAVLDPKTREFKFVFYYKLRDNIVSEDIIMIE
jgi:superfamily II DNA/RNA helicase